MPELPEAQVLSLQLKKALVNQVFRSYQTHDIAALQGDLNKLIGLTVTHIDRRAKNIVFHFSGYLLIVFLAMTGKVHVHELDTPSSKHDRIMLSFDKLKVAFNDTRRLGKVVVTELSAEAFFADWGPEPLTENFSASYLKSYIGKRTKSIKSLVMDNACVVGIGNIYACEILCAAKVHPAREARSLSWEEIERLVTAAKRILAMSIDKGGTTFRDYEHANGDAGGYQKHLLVYRQAACKGCGAEVQRIILAGRGSYYCPTCQK
jgi:formamidopyrimidine-DNA glycosylase